MEQRERIAYYEALLDRITAANAELERALTVFRQARPALKELNSTTMT